MVCVMRNVTQNYVFWMDLTARTKENQSLIAGTVNFLWHILQDLYVMLYGCVQFQMASELTHKSLSKNKFIVITVLRN